MVTRGSIKMSLALPHPEERERDKKESKPRLRVALCITEGKERYVFNRIIEKARAAHIAEYQTGDDLVQRIGKDTRLVILDSSAPPNALSVTATIQQLKSNGYRGYICIYSSTEYYTTHYKSLGADNCLEKGAENMRSELIRIVTKC